jgi:steroid delta-isomerase-like uncharacterized protein
MDTDASKQLIRRFVQEIFVEGRPDSVDELVAPDFESHTWPSTGDGHADLKAAIERVGRALEDVRFEVEDLIAEGDRVVARVTSSARQVGEFMGLPPSGRGYRVEEIHIFRVRDGQVVEHWLQMDTMGMLQQLGAMPAKG